MRLVALDVTSFFTLTSSSQEWFPEPSSSTASTTSSWHHPCSASTRKETGTPAPRNMSARVWVDLIQEACVMTTHKAPRCTTGSNSMIYCVFQICKQGWLAPAFSLDASLAHLYSLDLLILWGGSRCLWLGWYFTSSQWLDSFLALLNTSCTFSWYWEASLRLAGTTWHMSMLSKLCQRDCRIMVALPYFWCLLRLKW